MSTPSADQRDGASMARRFVATLTALDPQSPAFADHAANLSATGRSELRESVELSERSAARWATGAPGISGVVVALRTTRDVLSDLDPQPSGLRRILGRRDPEGLAGRFTRMRPRLETSLRSLSAAVDALRKDVAGADADIEAVAAVAARLRERAQALAGVEVELGAQAGAFPEVRALAGERRQELLTQEAVCLQTGLAVAAVRANAAALVDAADRARRVTGGLVSAADAAGQLAALQEAFGGVDEALGAAERGR